MPIPDFSPSLHLALSTGDKSPAIFNQMLKECEIFYLSKFRDISDSSYYQSIGKKLVTKYKCLAYHGGKYPWSFVVSKLSQRIRTARWRQNGKFKRDVDTDNAPEAAPKKFKLGNRRTVVSTTMGLDENDFTSHMAEIRKEWEGNQNSKHLHSLLNETRTSRQQWMSSLKPGKFKPIIERFPCFEEGGFVLHEFFSMRNPSNPDQARIDMVGKMEWLMKTVAKESKTSNEGSEPAKALLLITKLEDLVGKKKGKGQRSKSFLKVVKDVAGVETINEKYLETQPEQAPCIIIFMGQMEEVVAIYVVGDETKIFSQTNSILDALIILVACYYVFDLEYPAIYSQVLGLLQHWVVGDPYTDTKGTSWIKFSDLLSRTGQKDD